LMNIDSAGLFSVADSILLAVGLACAYSVRPASGGGAWEAASAPDAYNAVCPTNKTNSNAARGLFSLLSQVRSRGGTAKDWNSQNGNNGRRVLLGPELLGVHS